MASDEKPEFSPNTYDELHKYFGQKDQDRAIDLIYDLLSPGQSLGEILVQMTPRDNNELNTSQNVPNTEILGGSFLPTSSDSSGAAQQKSTPGAVLSTLPPIAPESGQQGAEPLQFIPLYLATVIASIALAGIFLIGLAGISLMERLPGTEQFSGGEPAGVRDAIMAVAVAPLPEASTELAPATTEPITAVAAEPQKTTAEPAAAIAEPTTTETAEPQTTAAEPATATADPTTAETAEPQKTTEPSMAAIAAVSTETTDRQPPAAEAVAEGPHADASVNGRVESAKTAQRWAERPISETETAALITRGDALLATGDVTSARLLYRYGAEAGDGTAAFRLGATFDPVFLGRVYLWGIAGDSAMATHWYRRARDLGNADAVALLQHLQTRN